MTTVELYDVLITAFGVGVSRSAQEKRSLRAAGGFLVAIGAVGLVFTPFTPFAPMHVRGAEQRLTDRMHIVFTSVTSAADQELPCDAH